MLEARVQVPVDPRMDWSPQQETALKMLGKFLREPYNPEKPIFYLAGFAGVGKTTLAREIAQECNGTFLFAAYTGKAAYVMRQKGCTDARTIHSLIYRPAGEAKSELMRLFELEVSKFHADPPQDEALKQRKIEELEKKRDEILLKERRKPMFTLNEDSELQDAEAICIDECSMVDEDMGRDLLSFKKKIIVLGDPMQLPPVGGGGYFTNRKPDFLLTEIHRHAKESGILRLATDVRLNGFYNKTPGHYGADCTVGVKDRASLREIVMEADQILVGKNVTRHQYNARLRELHGKPDILPTGGDKIVCLRNNRKAGLLNGSLWRIHEAINDIDSCTTDMTISSEEDGATGIQVACWSHHFLGKEDELKLKKWNRRDFEEFDYGYALTVHKSQGSQWDDVVLFDESYAFRADRQKWLYTGATRAAKKLVIEI